MQENFYISQIYSVCIYTHKRRWEGSNRFDILVENIYSQWPIQRNFQLYLVAAGQVENAHTTRNRHNWTNCILQSCENFHNECKFCLLRGKIVRKWGRWNWALEGKSRKCVCVFVCEESQVKKRGDIRKRDEEEREEFSGASFGCIRVMWRRGDNPLASGDK